MGLSLGQEPVSEPRGKHSPCAHGACFGDRQHTDSCGLNGVSGGDRCRGETEAGWRPGGRGQECEEWEQGVYYSVSLFGKSFSKKMPFGRPWWPGG